MAEQSSPSPFLPNRNSVLSSLGPSRMAQAIARFDWASTSLGGPEEWPLSLVAALRLVLNTSQPICLWWGPDLINFHNDAYEPMLGARRDMAIGRQARLLWPDVWNDVEPLVSEALSGRSMRMEDLPLLMTRNGFPEPTNWSFSYSPVFDDQGRIAGMMNIVVETTGAVQTRERLRQALEEAQEHLRAQRVLEERQQALQAELAHRMKNTLAMTQAIVSQTLRHSASAEEAAATIQGRLVAMAQAQDLLVRGGTSSAAIRSVVERALEPHRNVHAPIALAGPDLVLEGQQALGLSLAVHELATNATKYGAFKHEEGAVDICWSISEGEQFFF